MDERRATPTRALVERFSDGVTARLATSHAVTSPLGLWLMLALLAPAATGTDRTELEDALGTDADDAHARAAELLGAGHPAVATAAAVWSRPELLDTVRFPAWAATLPSVVETSPVPDQEGADAWARERSLGLVDHFPVAVARDTAAVLASAVATRVAWAKPFDEAPATALGGPFGSRVSSALRAPASHTRAIVRTEAAGDVVVHAAGSGTGLLVVSVIAAAGVAPAAVHVAARQSAALLRGESDAGAEPISLFDLPLGVGHAWTLAETTEERVGVRGDTLETVDVVLAAWEARSDHDLAGLPGVGPAARTLGGLLRPDAGPAEVEARQAAAATFDREGFEAAAVTGMAMRAGAAPVARLVRHRTAHATFHRPHAVLAVATNQGTDPAQPWRTVDLGAPAWADLPVFSAWVGHPRG